MLRCRSASRPAEMRKTRVSCVVRGGLLRARPALRASWRGPTSIHFRSLTAWLNAARIRSSARFTVARTRMFRLRAIHSWTSCVRMSECLLLARGALHHFMRRSPFHLPESVPSATAIPCAARTMAWSEGLRVSMGDAGRGGAGEAGRLSAVCALETKNPGKSMTGRGSCAIAMVPRRGLEPPRCYSLVPETSASTNSAIWAHMLLGMNPCSRF